MQLQEQPSYKDRPMSDLEQLLAFQYHMNHSCNIQLALEQTMAYRERFGVQWSPPVAASFFPQKNLFLCLHLTGCTILTGILPTQQW
jgi:hypothetical protein